MWILVWKSEACRRVKLKVGFPDGGDDLNKSLEVGRAAQDSTGVCRLGKNPGIRGHLGLTGGRQK